MARVTQQELRQLSLQRRQSLLSQREAQEQAREFQRLEEIERQEALKEQQRLQTEAQAQAQTQAEIKERAMYYVNRYAQTSSLGEIPEKYRGEVNRLLADPEIKRKIRFSQYQISQTGLSPELLETFGGTKITSYEKIPVTKLPSTIEQVKVQKLPDVFQLPLTTLEKTIGSQIVVRGGKVYTVPLMSTFEGVKPAYEIAYAPKIEKTPWITVGIGGISISKEKVLEKMKETPIPFLEKIPKEITSRGIDLTKQRGFFRPIGEIAKFETTIQRQKVTKIKKQEQIKVALDKLNKAETYEEQQIALENLKKAGISYKLVNGNIEITTPEAKKVYGTLGTIVVGVLKDIKGATKEWAREVTTLIEKPVKKIPYETREKISEAPGLFFKKAYEELGIKKGIEYMKVTPAPGERKWVQKGVVTKGVPLPTMFGDIKIAVGKPFISLEKVYRKEVKKEVREPGRVRFFIEKLGIGAEQAGRGISETYFQAKKGKLVSPWIGEKTVGYQYTPQAIITGKVSKFVGETALYGVPTVGTTIIAAPFLEAAGRRELKSYIKTHPLETAIAGLWIGGKLVSGGIRVGRYMKEPITTKLPKPKPRLIKVDVIQPVKKGEVIVERGKYILEMYTPARKAEVTTRWGKLLGKKPTIIDITRPSKYKIYTPAEITIKKGGVVSKEYFYAQRIGKKTAGYVTVSKFSSVQEPLTIEAFKKLPRMERFKFYELAKKTKTGGVVFPEELTPQILGEDFLYSTGQIEAQKLFRLYPKKMAIRGFKPGRTIYRGDITTIAKEITPERFKEAGYQIYKTGTVAKDVTKPFTRATGELPYIKGPTIIKPIKDITPGDIYSLPKTLRQIQRVKLSPQTVQALEQIKLTAIKTLPKPSILKGAIPKPSPILTSQELAPRMVGGLGKGVSEYAGPTYAPQEEITYISDTGAIITRRDITAPRVDTGMVLDIKTKQEQIPLTKLGTIQLQKLDIKQVSIPKVIQIPVTETSQIIKTAQVTKTAQITKQILKQQQIQKIAQILTPQITQVTKPLIPQIPKVPPPIIPGITGLGKALKKVKEMKPELFEVFARKFGKDVPIGKFPTLKKAREKLIGELKTTLRAGAFIEKAGKKVKFGELKLGAEFRPGKKEPWRIIQKKEQRLKEAGETKEIQFFRKTKKGKRRKNLFEI